MTQDPTASVKQNGDTVLRNQQRSFHALQRRVWQKSRFCRDLYSDVGVRENKLEEATLTDLPIVGRRRAGELGWYANAGKTLRSCSDDEPRAS